MSKNVEFLLRISRSYGGKILFLERAHSILYYGKKKKMLLDSIYQFSVFFFVEVLTLISLSFEPALIFVRFLNLTMILGDFMQSYE